MTKMRKEKIEQARKQKEEKDDDPVTSEKNTKTRAKIGRIGDGPLCKNDYYDANLMMGRFK